jgi:hypothetical protein
MNNQPLFKERQRFTQWWLWLLLLGINGLFVYGVCKQVIGGEQFGDKPMSDAGLIVVTAVMLLFTALFFISRLETRITEDGIYVRFFPFHISFRHYSWQQISKAWVRKYSPVGEYGGWGIRTAFSRKGKAFSVSGNQGLQIEFSNCKKLLIGTHRPDELREVLNNPRPMK